MSAQTGAPWVAVVLSSLCYSAFAVFSFKELIVLNIWLYSIALILELAAFVALRYRAPELPRPWRVGGGAVGMWLVAGLPAALSVLAMATAGWTNTVAGLIAALTGPLVYAAARQGGLRRADDHLRERAPLLRPRPPTARIIASASAASSALPRGGVGARRRPALRAASQTPARKRGSSRRPPAQLTGIGWPQPEAPRQIGHQLRQRDMGPHDDGRPGDGAPASRRAQGRRRQRGHAGHRVGPQGETAQREGAGVAARDGQPCAADPERRALVAQEGSQPPRATELPRRSRPSAMEPVPARSRMPGRSPKAPSRAASTSEITRTRRPRPRNRAVAARRSAGVHTPREATTSAPT